MRKTKFSGVVLAAIAAAALCMNGCGPKNSETTAAATTAAAATAAETTAEETTAEETTAEETTAEETTAEETTEAEAAAEEKKADAAEAADEDSEDGPGAEEAGAENPEIEEAEARDTSCRTTPRAIWKSRSRPRASGRSRRHSKNVRRTGAVRERSGPFEVFQKTLEIARKVCYHLSCCDTIAMKREVAVCHRRGIPWSECHVTKLATSHCTNEERLLR